MTLRTRYDRDRRPVSRLLTLLTASVLVLPTVALGGASAQAADAIPEWQKYEPKSYDTSPTPPDRAARVATPQDSALNELNGDVVISWWLLKDPKNPMHSLILLEGEVGWPQPRRIGQTGQFVWALVDEENASTPQFPFLNGIVSFKRGLPFSGWPDSTRIDGKPGMRSRSFNIDHLPESNTWHVQAKSPFTSANFTVDHVVPGTRGSYFPPDGSKGAETTNLDTVLNSRVTGNATLNGRKFDLNGWRASYWRLNFGHSIFDSQFNPATAWRGWEWNTVFEPDGGSSQFYAMMDPNGRLHGYLVDARPSGTRVCSRAVFKFGDYRFGRSMFGDVSPPFQRYTIPGWIKVKCAPGEKVKMEKTFYPDSADYVDAGLVTATEMPMHTVPGSFGTYEHMRYTTYRMQKSREATGSQNNTPPRR